MSLRSWLLTKPIKSNLLYNIISEGLIRGLQSSIQDYYDGEKSRLLLNYVFKHSKHPKCKDPFDFLQLLQRRSVSGGIIPWYEAMTIDQTQKQLIANKYCYLYYLAGYSPEKVRNSYGYAMLMYEPKLSEGSSTNSNIEFPNYTFLRCMVGSASFWDIIKGYWYYLFTKKAPIQVFRDVHFKDKVPKKFSKIFIQLNKNWKASLNIIPFHGTSVLSISTLAQEYSIPIIEADLLNQNFTCFRSVEHSIPWPLINDAKSYYIK